MYFFDKGEEASLAARDSLPYTQSPPTTWAGTGGSATIDNSIAYVQRLIERDEQTDADETVVRLEAGRSLKGTYYQKDGTGINFTVDLKSAMSGLVGATGLAIAASITLLTF